MSNLEDGSIRLEDRDWELAVGITKQIRDQLLALEFAELAEGINSIISKVRSEFSNLSEDAQIQLLTIEILKHCILADHMNIADYYSSQYEDREFNKRSIKNLKYQLQTDAIKTINTNITTISLNALLAVSVVLSAIKDKSTINPETLELNRNQVSLTQNIIRLWSVTNLISEILATGISIQAVAQRMTEPGNSSRGNEAFIKKIRDKKYPEVTIERLQKIQELHQEITSEAKIENKLNPDKWPTPEHLTKIQATAFAQERTRLINEPDTSETKVSAKLYSYLFTEILNLQSPLIGRIITPHLATNGLAEPKPWHNALYGMKQGRRTYAPVLAQAANQYLTDLEEFRKTYKKLRRKLTNGEIADYIMQTGGCHLGTLDSASTKFIRLVGEHRHDVYPAELKQLKALEKEFQRLEKIRQQDLLKFKPQEYDDHPLERLIFNKITYRCFYYLQKIGYTQTEIQETLNNNPGIGSALDSYLNSKKYYYQHRFSPKPETVHRLLELTNLAISADNKPARTAFLDIELPDRLRETAQLKTRQTILRNRYNTKTTETDSQEHALQIAIASEITEKITPDTSWSAYDFEDLELITLLEAADNTSNIDKILKLLPTNIADNYIAASDFYKLRPTEIAGAECQKLMKTGCPWMSCGNHLAIVRVNTDGTVELNNNVLDQDNNLKPEAITCKLALPMDANPNTTKHGATRSLATVGKALGVNRETARKTENLALKKISAHLA